MAGAATSSMPFGETYNWNKVFKIRDPEMRKKHFEAMEKEINKLLDGNNMRWEHLPPGEVAIPSVGVFRIKLHDLHSGGGGEPVLKARFCANGQQAETPFGGWDSTATVASYSSILQVVAIATQLKMKLSQIDVKSAFTQVKLQPDQKIWVKPLPGMGDPTGEKRVYRLVNHLYGHPLANAAFQNLWVALVQEFGFAKVDESGTVFSYVQGEDRMLVATVVDDSIVAYTSDAVFQRFCQFLETKLPIQVAPLEHVCGMRIRRLDNGSMTVDQTEYIEKKAAQFKCDDPKMTRYTTPMSANFQFVPRPEVVDVKLVAKARELMGSLIYASITRPDCKYPCSKLASVVTNPTEDDILAMRRVLRYLYVTRNSPLVFTPGKWVGPDGWEHEPLELSIFVDANFAKESGRHSQTGFALMLGGAAVHSKSGKQTQVTDSTPYAETIALHEAANWALVVRRYLSKMFAPQTEPTLIYEDNQAAETFACKGGGP